jgi:hypothetical protein
MNEKYLRLGYSESDLLFTYFIVNYSCNNINILEDIYLKENTENILRWFYKTSGFYDKSIEHININCFFSHYFKIYMNKLIDIIKKSTKCVIFLHEHIKVYYTYFGEFVRFLDDKVFCEIWYDNKVEYNNQFENFYNINKFMENKTILLINPLSGLMHEQFISGSVYKANNVNFPSVNGIIPYKNIYTFFNKGPNNNMAETFFELCNGIKEITQDYDGAVISCGAYSCLIANYIFNELNKNVFVIGGELNDKFALKTTRHINHNPTFSYNEYWILVPDELKPNSYNEIEEGCYW